ncbi:MAG: tryptophan synthase subunit alpha [Promethearchaeota archaeon]
MNDKNEIINVFLDLKKKKQGVFMPFFVAGDPNKEVFLELMDKIKEHVDIIELGIPFSDPVADGMTIQDANMRAFSSGMNFRKACEIIKDVKHLTGKPIVVLTYANVIGVQERKIKVLDALKDAGVNGIIIADVPIEEAGEYKNAIEEREMTMIFIVAPTTNDKRLEAIVKDTRGFIYLVAIKGVTGAREDVAPDTVALLKNLKSMHDVLVCVGFGISKPNHVKKLIKNGADGVIVGSALIRLIAKNFHAGKTKMISEIVGLIKALKHETEIDKDAI